MCRALPPGLRRSLKQALTVGSLGTAAAAGGQLVGLAGALAQTAGAAVAIPAAAGTGCKVNGGNQDKG